MVLSLDLDNWRGLEDHQFLVFEINKGYRYDANHNFWRDGLPSGFIQAVENGYPAEDIWVSSYNSYGDVNSPAYGWDSEPFEILYDSIFTEKELAYFDKTLERFVKISDSLAIENIHTIGVIFPMHPDYKNTGAFGLYGLQRSIAQEKIAWLDSIAKTRTHLHILDENKMGYHDYTNEMAQNRDHLSSIGAKQLTLRLDTLLQSIFKK